MNEYLLMHMGEREYRYEDYIMTGYLYIIYLLLLDDAEDILKWSVKNGLIYVKISKPT